MPEGVIAKVANDQRLVFGWASVIRKDDKIVVDRQTDFIDDDAELEKTAYDYVLFSRDGGDMHIAKGVSRLVESMVFTRDKIEKMGLPAETPVGWWIGFKVDNDDTWEAVKKGEYTGFSIGGRGVRKKQSISDDTHQGEE